MDKTSRLLEVPADAVVKALREPDKVKHKELLARLKKFDDRKPAPLPVAMGLSHGPAVKTFVLERGELKNIGDEVKAGFPTAVWSGEEPEGRRSTLARHASRWNRRRAPAYTRARCQSPTNFVTFVTSSVSFVRSTRKRRSDRNTRSPTPSSVGRRRSRSRYARSR